MYKCKHKLSSETEVKISDQTRYSENHPPPQDFTNKSPLTVNKLGNKACNANIQFSNTIDRVTTTGAR